jgi:hypothetical protein
MRTINGIVMLFFLSSSGSAVFMRDAFADCPEHHTQRTVVLKSARFSDGYYSDEFLVSGYFQPECVRAARVIQDQVTLAEFRPHQRNRAHAFEVAIDASKEPVIEVEDHTGRRTSQKIDILAIRGITD